MTKREALSEFRAYVLPHVVATYGADDRVAISEAWNDWTDALCKEGRITLRQDETWVGPR
jgi:hypothetical protein